MRKRNLDFFRAYNAYQFPYIAVMTIFCIFFMMMYVYYYKAFDESHIVEKEKLAEKIKADFDMDQELKRTTKVQIIDDGIKVTLQTSILFALGSATLKTEVFPALGKLAGSIEELPEDYKVSIEGHTDNAPVWYGGDFASNWELSLYRSLSLVDFFVREGGSPGRFVALGHGEYKPLFPNDTPEHRASNRRVEILIRKRSIENIKLQHFDA